MAKEWWQNYFGQDYIETYQQAGYFDLTKKQTNFLVKKVFPRSTKTVLDLCCGHGRHAIELAKKGYKVTGIDYSAYAIDMAKREAKRQKLDIKFIRGDARQIKYANQFDVVINMFTAFGYGSRTDDQKILKNVARALKPKGVFFIDLMNPIWLWRNYKPAYRLVSGKYKVSAKRQFDFLDNTISETRTIIERGKKKTYHTKNRLYTLAELTEVLKQQSLVVTDAWGKFDGGSYDWDAKRLLVRARSNK